MCKLKTQYPDISTVRDVVSTLDGLKFPLEWIRKSDPALQYIAACVNILEEYCDAVEVAAAERKQAAEDTSDGGDEP